MSEQHFIECDGPRCEYRVYEPLEMTVVKNANGEVVLLDGWFTLTIDKEFHFHELRCLTDWCIQRERNK